MTQSADEETMTGAAGRLDRLMGHLRQDPGNPVLLLDAADAAVEARQGELARQLLARREQVGPLPAAGEHLKGLVALQLGDFAAAEAIFAGLIAEGHQAPGLSFNLAWAKAMLGDHAGALARLDDGVMAVAPKAPLLKIRMLHHLGRLEEALAEGADLMARHPHDGELAGALSLAALDGGRADLAAGYAAQAPQQADACSTLGMLALGDQDAARALPLFDRALAQQATHPHAWLGHGLARMAQGDARGAAVELEKAAGLFGVHIGSWIAAGWAHYADRDLVAARRCFDRALAIDETFAESQGAIAVVDLAEGRIDQARRRAEVALRLDRQCFSAALAISLLAEHDDNPGLAQKIRDRAMQVPIGPGGITIAQALLGIARNARKH
jgi:tetratricopeptide (TPR) repeat protein